MKFTKKIEFQVKIRVTRYFNKKRTDHYKDFNINACGKLVSSGMVINILLDIFKKHLNIPLICPLKKVKICQNFPLIKSINSKFIFQNIPIIIKDMELHTDFLPRIFLKTVFGFELKLRGLFTGQKKILNFYSYESIAEFVE